MKESKKRPGVLRIVGRILAGLLALLLLAVLGMLIVPLTENVDAAPVSGSADWMAKLPDEIPLSEIVLPGTHDSATQYVQLAFFSKCQSLSIAEQLAVGIRYLDIRLGDAEKGADYPRLMHGFTNCRTGVFGGTLTLDAVLADCYAFLAQHPTETILFAVKHEHGDASVADFQKTLQGFTQAREANWLLTDHIPTLGEARGKLVLLRRWEDEAGLGAEAGIPLLWENQNGHDDVSRSIAAEDQGSYCLWVQDRYEYGCDDKWTAFTAGLHAPIGEGDVLLSFLSTKGTAAYGHPWSFAKALNPKLEAMDANSLRGWIVVDFASPRLAEKIYSVNY